MFISSRSVGRYQIGRAVRLYLSPADLWILGYRPAHLTDLLLALNPSLGHFVGSCISQPGEFLVL
jgi:hypothetical protein